MANWRALFNTATGLLGGALIYLMTYDHPILRIYPTVIDGILGEGAYLVILLTLSGLANARTPAVAPLAAFVLYLSEVFLSSILLRTPRPLVYYGVASLLLFMTSRADDVKRGIYLSSIGAIASIIALSSFEVPQFGEGGYALLIAGLILITASLIKRKF